MNAQIKELWTRAANVSAAYPSGQNTSWETQVNFMEKFAELIVKECITVCANRGRQHDGLYSAWASDCSERIGKHFGVEQ